MAIELNSRVTGSIEDINEVVQERAATHEDHKFKLSKIQYNEDADGFLIHKDGEWIEWPFSRHAITQLNTKLKIPTGYILRCPPSLKSENYSYWFSKTSGEALLRTSENNEGIRTVDGVQSPKAYTVIDNKDIVGGLVNNIDDDYKFTATFDGRDIFASATKGDGTFKMPDGTRIRTGFHLYNSEVGKGAAVVEILMFNEVDDAGFITRGWGGYRQVHRNKNSAQAIIELRKAIKKISENMDGAINDVKDLQNITCRDPSGIIEYLCDSTKPLLNSKQKESVENAFTSIGGNSFWDVVRAFSMAGTDENLSIEQRTTLMRLGGRVAHEAKTKLRIFRT